MTVHAASAGDVLESRLVANNESSTAVIDQLALPQRLGNTSHTWTMYAEYSSNVLVRDLEFVAAASLMERQQPTAKALFDRMESVADHALRKLLDLCVDVIVQHALQM